MKYIFFILFSWMIFSNNYCKAQISERVDSVANEICKSFYSFSNPLDSQSVTEVFLKHLSKYVTKMSQDVAVKTINSIDLRLQTTCQKYVDYVNTVIQSKDWIDVKECPRSELTEMELNQFFKITHFKYVESNGDTTKLKLTTSEWIDYLKDGTYSRLTLKRLSPSDFVIEFVESNSDHKANLSAVGDKYYYSIISKGKRYYTLCVTLPRLKGGTLFKVFY